MESGLLQGLIAHNFRKTAHNDRNRHMTLLSSIPISLVLNLPLLLEQFSTHSHRPLHLAFFPLEVLRIILAPLPADIIALALPLCGNLKLNSKLNKSISTLLLKASTIH